MPSKWKPCLPGQHRIGRKQHPELALLFETISSRQRQQALAKIGPNADVLEILAQQLSQ